MRTTYFTADGKLEDADNEQGLFRGTYLNTVNPMNYKGEPKSGLFDSAETFRAVLERWNLTVHYKYEFVSCERIPTSRELSFDI